jgi:hypothetical protein
VLVVTVLVIGLRAPAPVCLSVVSVCSTCEINVKSSSVVCLRIVLSWLGVIIARVELSELGVTIARVGLGVTIARVELSNRLGVIIARVGLTC